MWYRVLFLVGCFSFLHLCTLILSQVMLFDSMNVGPAVNTTMLIPSVPVLRIQGVSQGSISVTVSVGFAFVRSFQFFSLDNMTAPLFIATGLAPSPAGVFTLSLPALRPYTVFNVLVRVFGCVNCVAVRTQVLLVSLLCIVLNACVPHTMPMPHR
jgi:hypothetical protein